jgi:hypothetical protein
MLDIKFASGAVIRWHASGHLTRFRLPGWLRGCETLFAKAGGRTMIAVEAEAKHDFPALELIIDSLSLNLKS